MTSYFQWLDFSKLCAYFIYILVSIIALRFLVNYLFGKTHLAKCISQLPTVELPFLLTPILSRGFTNAPPQAILMHIMNGICYLFGKSRIFCFWIAYNPVVVFYKPETIEVLLNNHKTIDKAAEYKVTEILWGEGLLSISADKWRNRRKMIDPAFHVSVLKNFMQVFNEQSMVFVKILLDKGENSPIFDIVPLSKACALDIICETAMGVSIKAQTDDCTEFAYALGQLEENAVDVFVRPWYKFKFFFNILPFGRKILKYATFIREATSTIIKKKKESMKNNENNNASEKSDMGFSEARKKKALLELLLECQQKNSSFTDKDILDEVTTIILAGHDTSGMAVSYTLHCLGLHPEIQEKVIQEMDSIFGDDVDRPVTNEDLNSMKYTECVIKESLRLCPVAPIAARSLKDDLKVLDYTIPPGALCLIYLPMLNLDPESFPDPYKFDPERFFPENSIGRHPYAFVPFLAGPRNCIGQRFAMMEVKTILGNIFRNMKVTSVDEHDQFHIMIGPTFKNANPLRMKITSRRTHCT